MSRVRSSIKWSINGIGLSSITSSGSRGTAAVSRSAGEARADGLALAARFAAYEDHLEECANTLLSNYRDSNRAARRSAAPSHFTQRWRLAPRGEVQVRTSAGPDPVSLDPALTEIRQLHDELLTEYEALLAEAEGKLLPGSQES
ncbi:hypothetical protein J4558_10335 [Leptolyngbya sp. 15MV]|nr:hypothetical protein J4558_10335 [Leptolyngbya sp. 15MV]